MVLCEIKKLDGKCRLQIPTEFITKAGGKGNSSVYVMYNEKTKEIKIRVKENENGTTT